MYTTGYTTIIFDCDGVLIDSNQRKVSAFVDAMPSGASVQQRLQFAETMARSFGKSRTWLLETFAQICPEYAQPEQLQALQARYAASVSDGYPTWPATEGSLSFIKANASSKALYVASGSSEEELKLVFKKRGLSTYFADILGGPCPKRDNLNRILSIADGPALFIGDSIIDFESAQGLEGLDFVFYTPYSIDQERVTRFAEQHRIPVIHSFEELAS